MDNNMTTSEKIHKIRESRVYLRNLLHKIKIQLEKDPNPRLFKLRANYRKRLRKLNFKLENIRNGIACKKS